MDNYEPQLMYALDSLGEYSDWKNVYNVSGDDVCYCPICLGKVKLWNGQNPNKKYVKQRCFHHIDGMCSMESRIHFAYKTWLLEKGSKIKIGDKVYEVINAEIEKTYHTKFGDYRPDIAILTSDEKTLFIEIANTNKKTVEYVEKWDELDCDVLELDINEQLVSVATNNIPEFKIIYSSSTGECYIKHYIRQDYDDLITARKIYWKREDLIKYKIQWERLDWFWRRLQTFYSDNSAINDLVDSFKQLDPADQRFICGKLKGKHRYLRYELEKNYTNKDDAENAKLKHISLVVRQLNDEFGYKASNISGNGESSVCLFRKEKHVIFKDAPSWNKNSRSQLYLYNYVTPQDVYDHFHPIMQKYFQEHTIPYREELEKEKLHQKENQQYIKDFLYPQLSAIKAKVNHCKNKAWHMSTHRKKDFSSFDVELTLLDNWHDKLYICDKDKDIEVYDMQTQITELMNRMLTTAKKGSTTYYYNPFRDDEGVRIMEEHKDEN